MYPITHVTSGNIKRENDGFYLVLSAFNEKKEVGHLKITFIFNYCTCGSYSTLLCMCKKYRTVATVHGETFTYRPEYFVNPFSNKPTKFAIGRISDKKELFVKTVLGKDENMKNNLSFIAEMANFLGEVFKKEESLYDEKEKREFLHAFCSLKVGPKDKESTAFLRFISIDARFVFKAVINWEEKEVTHFLSEVGSDEKEIKLDFSSVPFQKELKELLFSPTHRLRLLV